MNALENDLRDELRRRVAAPPTLPHLAETALRRGRGAHRRRRTVVAAACAAVIGLAMSSTSLLPALPDRRPESAAAPLDGAPRVPLFVGQAPAELLDWPQDVQRSRPLSDPVRPVAQVPAGVVVIIGGGDPKLGLLEPDGDEPRVIVDRLDGDGAAVSDDGRRASIVIRAGYGRSLQEVELPSGRVLRSVALAPPTFGVEEPVQPIAYSGNAILINIGGGSQQRTMLWEGQDDGVVGNIEGVLATLGGADAPFSDDHDAIGGRAAFRLSDQPCGTQIHELRNGDGDSWKLCRETFVGFSPDGRAVLATDAAGDALVVHDADGGDVRRTFQVPRGVRASGWESNDTVLYTTVDGPRTVVVRCSVDRGACATAADFPNTDRIPQPVPSR